MKYGVHSSVDRWSLDLVTVSFSDELLSLKLQARSLSKFVPKGAFGTIFVIVNDADFKGFARYFETHIVPEYGVHTACVELLDGRALAGRKIPKNGWRSQQPLKLLAARAVDAQQYLILDSKNHFVKPFDQSWAVASDGRLISHTYPVIEGFSENYRNACRYFGAPEGKTARPVVLPTATPFMVSTHQAEQLLEHVESREKTTFFDFFLSTKAFTEFYFYDAFLRRQNGLLDALYDIRTKPNITLFASDAKNPEAALRAAARLGEDPIRIFGVHRKVFEAANKDVLSVVASVWCGCGLVDSTAAAAAFMEPGPPYKKTVFKFF